MLNRRKVGTIILLAASFAALLGGLGAVMISRYSRRTIYVRGAVIKKDGDPMKESPITDVEVKVANGLGVSSAKSNFAGFYSIRLVRG